MIGSLALLAQATEGTRTLFEWGRIQSNVDWILPLAAFAGVALWVGLLYRRDAAEFGPWRRWSLVGLRLAAFAGLLLIYLQPQMRTERDVTTNSRALLLVDTSLSMGLEDDQSPSVPGGTSRAQQVIRTLEGTDLLDSLRARHDVSVLRFDEEVRPIATVSKHSAAIPPGDADDSTAVIEQSSADVDWASALAPRGTETRLGQSLREVLVTERSAPLSGIVVFTDGGQNAGLGPAAAVQVARDAGVPIFPVGIGSDRQPINVRVSDLVAPARAYPGDSYTVTGYLQSQGLAGRSVVVELVSRDATVEDERAASQLERAVDVILGDDGEVTPVRIELTPDEAGRRTLRLRVQAPPADSNPNDNEQQVDIEIIDRKTRVLLFAGGPTREYSFLRTQLHRDESITADVLLQTGLPGMSQEAEEILTDFPSTREEMFRYDAVVAFDPNWQALSPEQIDLLETWVADQAGGLVLVAGPVHTHSWVQDQGLSKLRDLYPVEFNRRFSLLDDGRFGSKEPWPIQFTREGRDAEFLWIEDSAVRSQQAWDAFPGVYGYYEVRGPKPGATVYGYYSDPRAGQGSDRAVYLCGQFYGSGRVFYAGSGEIWRLRALDEAYFERYYTKLLRHVSQGRLLRGSSRGVLLVERDRYLLGQTVAVRAQVTDAQLEPLDAPQLPLQVVLPDNTTQTIQLAPDPRRVGTYSGQFSARQEGNYRLELPVPESDDERLTRRVQVRVPDLERENPQRNDALLSEIAEATGGRYFRGLDEALGRGGTEPLAALLKDQSKTLPVSDAPQPLWDNRWFLFAICGFLCLEWFVRRISKLA